MHFHNIRLPSFLEVCAIGVPEFSTNQVVTKSGREIQHQNHINRQKYLFKNCYLSKTEFEQFNNFFKARNGSKSSFLFRDYSDYKGVNQFIAKGDGKSSQFQLTRVYGDSACSYLKPIISVENSSIELYINNIKTEFDIDHHTGKVMLPKILEQEQILTASFIFNIPVRFNKDSFDYLLADDGSILLSEIELIEMVN